MSKCKECGLYKESDDGFVWIVPSDCHDRGGHYMTRYDADGAFDFTDIPWQCGDGNSLPLTPEQMAGAKTTKGWWE